jgi:hypothetical protein
MRLIDLTHPLLHDQPSFPNDPTLSITAHATIATQKYNLSFISMGSHQGTHLDAMFHFIEDGKTVDQMPLDWFYGPARVLRIPKRQREELTVSDFKPFEQLLTRGQKSSTKPVGIDNSASRIILTIFLRSLRMPRGTWLREGSGSWGWTRRRLVATGLRCIVSF